MFAVTTADLAPLSPDVTSTLLRGLLALAVSFAVAPLVLLMLRRGQVLDHPSDRSSHVTATPRGGGIAPAVGALVALSFTPALPASFRWPVGLTATIFGLMGLLEDVFGIRALLRLAIQFAAAAISALFIVDQLAGSVLWRWTFAIGVVFWLVAFVNAYNFMDGIDGISVAQAVGAGATWLLVGLNTDSLVLAWGGAVVAGAALGFAPFNVPHARMFLGDVGSYFIGAWIAVVAALALRSGVPAEAVLAPLALYVADTGSTLLRRVLRGETWYLAHRDHAYQRLGDIGWSHARASALVAACIAICGALGMASLTDSVPARALADVAIVGVVAGYLVLPGWLAKSHSAMSLA